MEIYAIVGNPPYQEKQEKTSATPIYNLFMEKSFKVSQIVTLITPARFLFRAGKTPKEWNEKMLSNPHFKVGYYYPNGDDIFPSADIRGGVVISFHDLKQEFGNIGTFTTYAELSSILKKVINDKFITLSNIVYSSDSYKFTKKVHAENDWVANKLSKGHLFDITTNIFEKIPELLFDSQENNERVGLYGRLNNERTVKYIKKDYIEKHDNLDYFKVFVPKSSGSGAIGEVVSTPLIGHPLIGHPLIGHTQTFISIGAFETEDEASALLKYIKTTFCRCMLGTLKITQHNAKHAWTNVPLQDFTEKSDIDWNKSISDIDAQLYKKYNLTEKEINFIETMIKPME